MSRILISIVYVGLYVLWMARRGYSWTFFFAFEILMICAVVKTHYSFKRNTQKLRKSNPDAFADDAYWTLLVRYGVSVYAPQGAESIALSFTLSRFAGYLVSLIFLFLGRWMEAALCFANTFISAQMAGWLDPTFFMREFPHTKGLTHYESISDAIEELRAWVRTASM